MLGKVGQDTQSLDIVRRNIIQRKSEMQALLSKANALEMGSEKIQCYDKYMLLGREMAMSYVHLLAVSCKDGDSSQLSDAYISDMAEIARTSWAFPDAPRLWKSRSLVSMSMLDVSQRAWKVGRREDAIMYMAESVKNCRALVEHNVSSAKEICMASELVSAYMARADTGIDAFVADVRGVIERNKNEAFAVRVGMALPYRMSGFLGENTVGLYAYYSLLEQNLRNDNADPKIKDLYAELGEAAFSLGLIDEARKWYEIYLERWPSGDRAGSVKTSLRLCNEDLRKQFGQAMQEIGKTDVEASSRSTTKPSVVGGVVVDTGEAAERANPELQQEGMFETVLRYRYYYAVILLICAIAIAMRKCKKHV
jgi:tetratricopeptide (TPR) repeat protein